VGIDDPRVAVVVANPHIGQQLIARQDSARVVDQLAQEKKLGSGEGDRLPTPGHRALLDTDDQVSEAKP